MTDEQRLRGEEILEGNPSQVRLKGILKGKEASVSARQYAVGSLKVPYFSVKGRTIPDSEKAGARELLQKNGEIAKLKRLVSSLTKDADFRAKKAYQKGLSEGLEKGSSEKESELKKVHAKDLEESSKKLDEVLLALQNRTDDFFTETREGAVEMVLAAVERVLETVPEWFPEAVLKIVGRGMKKLGHEERIQVTVHPDDLPQVEEYSEDWKPLGSNTKNIVFLTDERVGRGGCLLESDSGSINQRIAKMREEILTLLRDLRPKEKQDPEVTSSEILKSTTELVPEKPEDENGELG